MGGVNVVSSLMEEQFEELPESEVRSHEHIAACDKSARAARLCGAIYHTGHIDGGGSRA